MSPSKTKELRFFVSDLTGRQLMTAEFRSAEKNRFRFQQDPGIYLFTVNIDGVNITRKVIVR